MLEETGFFAREEGDEFLVLTCPRCSKNIIFTQRADPADICEAAATHTYRCADKGRGQRPRMAEVAMAGR